MCLWCAFRARVCTYVKFLHATCKIELRPEIASCMSEFRQSASHGLAMSRSARGLIDHPFLSVRYTDPIS